MADIVTAIAELLKADAGVAALCGARVFGGELPPAEAKAMPRHAIVVQPSGGAPFAPGSKADVEQQRFDVIAYGETIFEATMLRHAAAACLKAVQRQISGGVLVHWVQSAGGLLTGRDRDGQWPYAFQSFQSLYATDEVA